MIFKFGKRLVIIKESNTDVLNTAGELMFMALESNDGITAEDLHGLVDTVESSFRKRRQPNEG